MMPPISDPPIPIAVVIQIGMGSGPGIANRASPPMTKPQIRIAMMKPSVTASPPARLVDRALDRLGQLVRVHQHLAVGVPRRAADRLDELRLAAQEAFLVGVEDRDQ